MLLIPATVVVACGGTILGGQNSYVAVRNRAPVELTCAEYLQQRPDAAWLRLTHCAADLDHIGVESNKRTTSGGGELTTTTGIYVPLRAEGASRIKPARIVVFGDDDAMLALGKGVSSGANQLEQELAASVEGLVQSGLALSERRRAELARLDLRLADDFVIVERGERPRPLWLALGELGLGLGALALLVRRYRRWSRRRPAPPPRATVVRE